MLFLGEAAEVLLILLKEGLLYTAEEEEQEILVILVVLLFLEATVETICLMALRPEAEEEAQKQTALDLGQALKASYEFGGLYNESTRY